MECNTREGTGTVSGLGKVAESYTYFADTDAAGCDPADVRILGTAVRFVVAGKGDIELTTAQAPCTSPLAGLTPATQAFTITGGTGVYAGASGSGTVSRALAQTDSGAAGSETWAGTLVVPGLEFDVTRPTLSGAVAKTVRARKGAKSMRVTYKVTAKDNVDGAVPASCHPRSGRRFKLGRTRVRCSATDSSGNVAEAAFTITVRPRR